MNSKKTRFNIGLKMYLFVTATVLFAVAGVSTLSYLIDSSQIDEFYKRMTVNSAIHYSRMVDAGFLSRLREVAMSDEYQQLRTQAEETDDESLVIGYLDEHGLWEQYVTERNKLRTYVEDMDEIEYLYLVTWA